MRVRDVEAVTTSHVSRCASVLTVLALCLSVEVQGQTSPRRTSANTAANDSADALATFRENITAIHRRDQARYLATYVHTNQLVRHSPAGMETGYENWSARTSNAWPDTLIVQEMRVTPIAPGVVYGYYRYIGVPAPGDTLTGVSTRVFVRTPQGMRITVTASWNDPLPAARKE
jgi:hypothetical protein